MLTKFELDVKQDTDNSDPGHVIEFVSYLDMVVIICEGREQRVHKSDFMRMANMMRTDEP